MGKEIELNETRQGLLHDLNEEMRIEARELEKDLSGIFNFEGSWDDNSMIITNLEAIEGKGEVIDKKYKRILEIIKELPKASQEWATKQLENLKIGESIADLQKQEVSARIANSKDWIEKRKFYDDWGADNEIAAWERVKAYIEEYYADGIINHKEYSDYMLEIDKNLASERKRLHDEEIKQYDEKMRKYEEERSAWVSARNEELQAQRDRLSALDSIQEAVVAIIRKRGEEEKKALDKAHNAEMKSLDERHNKRKDMYKEELDEFNKMIQGKIDAIDEQNAEEDYLEDLNKEREKATELQKEIDVLSLDDSLTARNKTIELRKQLADQNEKIAKMQQKREREVTKKSLQDQMKDKQQDVKERENIADELYNNEKKRLEEEYAINKEYLERKYSDEKVYAEARESIMRGTVETSKGMFQDIYSAYQDFENKFGKGMGILGDIIKRDFLDQLDKAQQAIRDLEYLERARDDYTNDDYQPRPPSRPEPSRSEPDRPSSGSSSGGIYMDSIDFMRYRTIKGAYDTYKKNNDRAGMEEAKRKAQEIRDKYGITSDKYSYDDLKGKSYKDVRFKKGGLTEKTGIHILDGEPGKPERVLSQQQTKSYDKFVFEDMPKLQDMLKTFDSSNFQNLLKSAVLPTVSVPRMANPVGSSGGDKYEINFDVKGNMDRSILPEVQRMITTTIKKTQENKISKYKDVGIKRPVY